MSAIADLRHRILERAEDIRAPPIAFTCLAFLSVLVGAQWKSILWIGATLLIDLLTLLLWGRPTPHFRVAVPPPEDQARLQRALAWCLEQLPQRLEVDCVVVEGEPFGEPATTFTRSRLAGTVYFRRDRLAGTPELQLRAILARELVHLTRRNDYRRWAVTAVSLFLLVAGSATVALLRLCLGSRVGAVDMLGSVAACFVGAPTALFLLQYALHDLELQADREVAHQNPALAAALVEWLQREEAQAVHLFVVIPHLAPSAAHRVEHLHRLANPSARGAWWSSVSRPLSALGAIALLAVIGVAVTDLLDGKVPDVAMDSSPATAAREAIDAAKEVQKDIDGFALPAAPRRAETEIREARAEIDALRAAFKDPKQQSR